MAANPERGVPPVTVPASIDQAALGDALESLGISLRPALLQRVVLDVRHAELTYEAIAEDGEPIVIDGHLATVTYHVPITPDAYLMGGE